VTHPTTPDTTPAPAAPATCGGGWKITPGTPGLHYPGKDTHMWGEFALVAVEMGGYGDATLVDPYTGSRLWVADGAQDSLPATLRSLAAVAERVGWPRRG